MPQPARFDGVSVDKKANVYFDGRCVSHTVHLADGSRKAWLRRRIIRQRVGVGVDDDRDRLVVGRLCGGRCGSDRYRGEGAGEG